MDKFCGSKFWDVNMTWYTEDPELTSCFQKTVLIWVPCAFLWILSSLETYYILHSKSRNIPWNWLNCTKLVLAVILIVLSAADIGYSVHQHRKGLDTFSVDYYVPVIKIITLALSVMLVIYNRKCGLRTSGLLFLFWLLMALCGSVQFRSELRKVRDPVTTDSVFPSISYLMYYSVVLIMFLLNCIADAEPKFSKYPPVKNPCPQQSASFQSRIMYLWFDKMVWKGFKSPLEMKDLWSMNPEDTSREIVPIFDKYWAETVRKSKKVSDHKAYFHKHSGSAELSGRKPKKKQEASILPVLCKSFGQTFLFGSLLRLMQDLLKFTSPIILSALILFVESDEPMWKGYLYAGLMLTVATLETLVMAHFFTRMELVALRIRTALISAIYRKALRLSNASRKESTVGEIVNLMSVDAQRFMDLTVYLNLIWSAPLQIILALIFLWRILGPSVLAGLAVMVVLIPINGLIVSKLEKLEEKQMKYKDQRVKLMNEILGGIRVLKLYAWETSFEEQVLKIRDKELRLHKTGAYYDSSMSFVWTCAPFLVSLATFATYMLVDKNNVLDPEKAFVSLTLFNMIRMPLAMLPTLIVNLIQTRVSVRRINKFMNLEELNPDNIHHDETVSQSLLIEKGTFSWGPDNDPTLKNITLQIDPGMLVAVVGIVGSGKSSLISAFLGEMDKLSGTVNTKGTIAYVPQQAWIQNATLKDNILFGKQTDQASYLKVVDACALKQDFEMLPAGDQTEIGEKGINLSGGQKQRVSLARAVYNNADVYFLDDPLSAVDSHVGKHIFENVIGPTGILKKKTRLLVTHSVTYLHEVDMIVVLKEGEVTEIGTYKELLERKGEFSKFIEQHIQDMAPEDNVSQTDVEDLRIEVHQRMNRLRSHLSESLSETSSFADRRSLSVISALHRQCSLENNQEKLKSYHCLNNENEPGVPVIGEKLIEDEKLEIGRVKWHVYSHYLKSIGLVMLLATFAGNLSFQGFAIGSNFWLSRWSKESYAVNTSQDDATKFMYLGIYTSLGIGNAIASFFCGLMPQLGCWLAARALHILMLQRILRAPLSFFDTTPIGRIIGRFSKDVDVLDSAMPGRFDDATYCTFEVLATLTVISCTTPIFTAVLAPIGLLYFLLQHFYVSTSRQLYRLESVYRSPIYSHFGESLTGSSTIRAYRLQQKFVDDSEKKVDLNQVCYFPGIIANRWLGIRVEMIGNLVIFFASLFAVLARDTMDAGLVGLSITYALQMTPNLSWLVTLISDVETDIVAVERIKEYCEVTQEASWQLSCTRNLMTWPSEGQVEFKDYQLRYREGLDLVLKGISFTVNGGEKIGIVGRTGAGKSSLTLGLFRIIEAAKGSIFIDGIDISKLGLHALRSRLTIIPQDPVLFSGSLRLNLDPFNSHSDEEVWRALDLAHLKAFVTGLIAGLSHEVTEGGENLSVGQRQLICLARALLRKTKVLILDEATAAVDLETDDLIQRTIRTEFSDCTVLTIAHRLNTIMDSTRVVVLDQGLAIEYDSPEVLLQNKGSVFYSMAKDAGLA